MLVPTYNDQTFIFVSASSSRSLQKSPESYIFLDKNPKKKTSKKPQKPKKTKEAKEANHKAPSTNFSPKEISEISPKKPKPNTGDPSATKKAKSSPKKKLTRVDDSAPSE
jgi:hypothetical protein